MSDTTTSTSTTAVVDEDARVRAFTALGLGLAALLGGGVFANAFQWLAMKAFNDNGSDQFYFAGIAVGPLLMGVVSLWLALITRTSSDALARPLARATVALSALAVAGSVFLMAVTVGGI